MATNDRSARTDKGRTNGDKDSDDQRDSLRHYLLYAPPDTDVKTIIAAYNSDTVARKIDWATFGGGDGD